LDFNLGIIKRTSLGMNRVGKEPTASGQMAPMRLELKPGLMALSMEAA
jgi:hypothetical protein